MINLTYKKILEELSCKFHSWKWKDLIDDCYSDYIEECESDWQTNDIKCLPLKKWLKTQDAEDFIMRMVKRGGYYGE